MEDGVFVEYPWKLRSNGGFGPCEGLERGDLGAERVKEEGLEQGGLEE